MRCMNLHKSSLRYPSLIPATQQARWKDAMLDVIARQGYTHAISLTWNRSVSLDRARADLQNLHHRVDRQLLGARFHRKPASLRTAAVFVVEKIETNLHVHSMWRLTRTTYFKFNKLFPPGGGGVWNDVIPSGTYDLVMDNNIGADRAFSGYMLKDQHRYSDDREIIFSSEFYR